MKYKKDYLFEVSDVLDLINANKIHIITIDPNTVCISDLPLVFNYEGFLLINKSHPDLTGKEVHDLISLQNKDIKLSDESLKRLYNNGTFCLADYSNRTIVKDFVNKYIVYHSEFNP